MKCWKCKIDESQVDNMTGYLTFETDDNNSQDKFIEYEIWLCTPCWKQWKEQHESKCKICRLNAYSKEDQREFAKDHYGKDAHLILNCGIEIREWQIAHFLKWIKEGEK